MKVSPVHCNISLSACKEKMCLSSLTVRSAMYSKADCIPSSQSRKGRITHRKGEKSWLSKIKQEHLLITLMSFWPNLRAGIGWLEKLMRCLRSELHIFPKMLADLLFFSCSHPASMGCWVLFSSCSPLSWCTPRCRVPWTGLIVKTTFMCCL